MSSMKREFSMKKGSSAEEGDSMEKGPSTEEVPSMEKGQSIEEVYSGKTVIRAQNINRIFPVAGGSFQALRDITLEIPKGHLTILRGRSGSGKTTLLNILGLLDQPTSGQVYIDGQDVGRLSEYAREELRRKQMGFVFQSVSLLPAMNVFQNVEFSIRMAGIRSGRKERAEECLRMVGLGGRLRHMPSELSGGEQQRVAIARAMAHRPRIIFADEPTAELDSAMGAEVARLFKEMCEKEKVTIVMTTHDVGLMGAGDTVLELESGCLKEGGSAMEERHSMEEGHSMEERHSMEEGSSKAEIPSREG